jgi:hypothetical protein
MLNHPDADVELGQKLCLLNIEGRWTRIREITIDTESQLVFIHSED